jgi:ferritin-like metal-binding protein YciE
MADNAQELFEHELKDIYDAEHKLVKALAKMSKDVENEDLSQGFEEHRKATEGHIKRLEKVFKLVEAAPRRQPCAGIDGLIKEYTKFVREEKPEAPVLDAFAAGAARKVEHYEMMAYEGLIELARQLGQEEAVELLGATLQEEEETDRKLQALSSELEEALVEASAEVE